MALTCVSQIGVCDSDRCGSQSRMSQWRVLCFTAPPAGQVASPSSHLVQGSLANSGPVPAPRALPAWTGAPQLVRVQRPPPAKLRLAWTKGGDHAAAPRALAQGHRAGCGRGNATWCGGHGQGQAPRTSPHNHCPAPLCCALRGPAAAISTLTCGSKTGHESHAVSKHPAASLTAPGSSPHAGVLTTLQACCQGTRRPLWPAPLGDSGQGDLSPSFSEHRLQADPLSPVWALAGTGLRVLLPSAGPRGDPRAGAGLRERQSPSQSPDRCPPHSPAECGPVSPR